MYNLIYIHFPALKIKSWSFLWTIPQTKLETICLPVFLPMWAYVHRDPMGSWQMARHCHTQMPTSYLEHLCQDKTHEAGIGIKQLGEQKKIFREKRRSEIDAKIRRCRDVSDQQKLQSSAFSRVAQARKDDYFCCAWNVFTERDMQLEMIHALNFVIMLIYDMMWWKKLRSVFKVLAHLLQIMY